LKLWVFASRTAVFVSPIFPGTPNYLEVTPKLLTGHSDRLDVRDLRGNVIITLVYLVKYFYVLKFGTARGPRIGINRPRILFKVFVR